MEPCRPKKEHYIWVLAGPNLPSGDHKYYHLSITTQIIKSKKQERIQALLDPNSRKDEQDCFITKTLIEILHHHHYQCQLTLQSTAIDFMENQLYPIWVALPGLATSHPASWHMHGCGSLVTTSSLSLSGANWRRNMVDYLGAKKSVFLLSKYE